MNIINFIIKNTFFYNVITYSKVLIALFYSNYVVT